MKIKKVDDKPMVIHTKKQAELHFYRAKELKIKGGNVLTTEQASNEKRGTVHQKAAKEKGALTQQIMTHFNRAMLPKLLLHDYEKKMIKMRLFCC